VKLQSKGLGSKELVLDFREYDISREGDDVVISGTIREPVTWNFSIRIRQDDIPGMLRVGLSRHTLRMGVRWALRRKNREIAVDGSGPAPAENDAQAPRPARKRVRRTVETARQSEGHA
jgi:hypothetical protein